MAKNARVASLSVSMLAAILLSVGSVSALELGVPFGFGNNTTFGAVDHDNWGSDVGVRLHISEGFALQPTISFGLKSEKKELSRFKPNGNLELYDSTWTTTNVGFNMDFLFYLFESSGIKQYLGANVGINFTGDPNNNIRLGGIYGLQRELVSSVDIFGQMGLGVRFKPSRVYTVNTQLGVIFYILK